MGQLQTITRGLEPELGTAEFRAIVAIMQTDARIHLSDAKSTLVHARLSRRLRDHRLTSFRDYLRLVDQDPAERAALVTALTTNHTHFFREKHHFDHLVADVRPALRARGRTDPLRLWSAGCSTGEEVYTLAMCLLGTDGPDAAWLTTGEADVRLLATDIAPPVVQATARGVYATATCDAIPRAYRDRWLRPVADGMEMAEVARRLVTARVLNLFGTWPMTHQFDVIFCRNVMIYFDDTAKAELEQRLVEQLAPGGFLYIGHSERLTGAVAHVMTPCGQTIYRKAGSQ